MPLLDDLSPEEYAEVVRLVRAAIDADRYPRSRRAKRLKSILEKLEPTPLATMTLALAKKLGEVR